METRRRVTLSASLLLALGALLGVNVRPVFAADTTNYAGKPINGYSYDAQGAPRVWDCDTST
jgi:hypothetical protein